MFVSPILLHAATKLKKKRNIIFYLLCYFAHLMCGCQCVGLQRLKKKHDFDVKIICAEQKKNQIALTTADCTTNTKYIVARRNDDKMKALWYILMMQLVKSKAHGEICRSIHIMCEWITVWAKTVTEMDYYHIWFVGIG